LDLPTTAGKAAAKIVPPHSRIPSWKGLCADSEEKHVLASDGETAEVDSLKALDPNRPIREADMRGRTQESRCLTIWRFAAMQSPRLKASYASRDGNGLPDRFVVRGVTLQ
jgi:hypothetical protein